MGQPRVTAQLLQLLETGGEFDVNQNQPQPQPQPQQPERGAPLRPPLEHHPTSMDDAALKVDFELVPEVVKEMMGEMNRDCGNLSAPESRGDGDDAGIYSGAVRPVSVTMNNGDAFHAQLEGAGAGTGARAGAVAWAASPVRASASDGDASSDRDSLPVPAVPVTTSGALAQDGSLGDDILWGFTDRWLTPGSIILHKLSMPDVGGEAEESPSPNKIESLAKSLAAGKLFDMCASNADETGEVPMYVSRDGRAARVHRDGSTTPVCHVDRSFLAQMLSACQVACSSPSVRCVDLVVPGVPPGFKFEGRFHDSMLLRVEEVSRHPSSFSSAPALAADNVVSSGGTKEDVHIRIHLPNCGVGVARVEAVWSHGPCRNMPSGAGFPLLLVPDEATARQIRTRFTRCGHGSEESAAATSPISCQFNRRRFSECVGYTLHAALHGEQSVAGSLTRLHAAALDMDLPLLCDVIVTALESLDYILEEEPTIVEDDDEPAMYWQDDTTKNKKAADDDNIKAACSANGDFCKINKDVYSSRRRLGGVGGRACEVRGFAGVMGACIGTIPSWLCAVRPAVLGQLLIAARLYTSTQNDDHDVRSYNTATGLPDEYTIVLYAAVFLRWTPSSFLGKFSRGCGGREETITGTFTPRQSRRLISKRRCTRG